MSCFKIPVAVHKTFDATSKKFFWSSGSKNMIPMVSKSTICESKKFGGLNVKQSTSMNQALLAKKAWELLISPTSLWRRLMKNKYFPNSTFINARCPVATSWGIGWNFALVAEALIARKAMLIALSLNFKKLIIESNNLLLVRLLSDLSEASPWRIRPIVGFK
ncbi:uncharacterized mitochondrial protein AtMg00310-like [Telopea speciosissima]|uniref:uncharacterized mitochondrial protein AtMg00310-like n=1 Tax=Telopea speciosissima TaxID=54955 RepID=UPI001CC400AB|nr:uncharacterized mitochondrial protein AtMg00310-like [Telopea speciosissima]